MTTTFGCCSKHGVNWYEDGECIECGIEREAGKSDAMERKIDEIESRLDDCMQRMENIISALEKALERINP